MTTRQRVGLVTVVLQGFVLGFPMVTSNDGKWATEDLTAVLDHFIEPGNLVGPVLMDIFSAKG